MTAVSDANRITRCAITGIFQYDTDYLQNEEKYKEIKTQILGDDSDEDDGSGSDESDESDDDDDEDARGLKTHFNAAHILLLGFVYIKLTTEIHFPL